MNAHCPEKAVMERVEALYGTTIHYERKTYPFDQLFLQVTKQNLAEEGKSLDELNRLHEVFAPETVGRLYGKCYEFMDNGLFFDLYRKFIHEIIQPLFREPIYYQKKPGFRVHLNNTLTVQYHTDEWYGHGQNIVNFWMPLTRAYSNNSLFVSSLEDSITEVGVLTRERAPMDEINARLARISKPLDLSVGDVHIFGGRVVHGTEKNDTDYTRVSLDFRVLLEGEDPGTKALTEYYETTRKDDSSTKKEVGVEKKTYVATSYIFSRYGFTHFISNNQQRMSNEDFARRNHIEIVAEETEIKTMTHHPMLLSLAAGKGTHDVNAVVVFSVLCLPPNEEDRQCIFEHAHRYGIVLFFANENLSFRTMEDFSVIEDKRTALLVQFSV